MPAEKPLPVYKCTYGICLGEREKTKYCRKLFFLEWVAVIRIYIYIKKKVQSIHINALQNVKIHLTTQGIPETVAQTLLLNFTDMY